MGQTLAFQLRSNTCNMLNATLKRYSWCDSDNCQKCGVLDDARHLVEKCKKYNAERDHLNEQLSLNITDFETPITFEELSGNSDYSLDDKERIEELFQQFAIDCAQNSCNKKYFNMLNTTTQEQYDRLF